jgi:DNA gyrase subunit B
MMPPIKKTNASEYSEENIKFLEPREHVRLRPGMYIGGTDKRALHHMIWEVLDNSVEEAMLGQCTKICIQILANHGVCIEDNSMGLPVHSYSEDEKKPLAELIMTDIRPKLSFGGSYYGVSGGIHGVGLCVVNSLSHFCQLEVKRDGFLWRQTYSEGLPTSPFENIRPLEMDESSGNRITFSPDFSILDDNDFDFDFIAYRCQELAFLYPKLELSVQDKRATERELRYHYPNGLLDWLMLQTEDEIPLASPLFIKYQSEMENQVLGKYKVGLDIAFQFWRA